LLLQHFLLLRGGQFAPESGGQFPAESVVSLRRNQVVNISEFSTSVAEIAKKYGDNFSRNNILQQFHTHPDGKLGATESDPALSGDVQNLPDERSYAPNASFIILYRTTPGQTNPSEYDYTKQKP